MSSGSSTIDAVLTVLSLHFNVDGWYLIETAAIIAVVSFFLGMFVCSEVHRRS